MNDAEANRGDMTSTPLDELVDEIHRVVPRPDDMDAWEAIYRPRSELEERAAKETSRPRPLTSSPPRPQVTASLVPTPLGGTRSYTSSLTSSRGHLRSLTHGSGLTSSPDA